MLTSVVTSNREALHKFEEISKMSFRDKYQISPADATYELRSLCGYRCAGCGGRNITGPAIAYAKYSEYGLCYPCQDKEKYVR